MKNLFIVMLALGLFATACKKERKNVIPGQKTTATPALIWNMNKSYTMNGWYSGWCGSSNGNYNTSREDTIRNQFYSVAVLNDTSLVFVHDTLMEFKFNSSNEYIDYIPKLYKQINFRPMPTYLRYYYEKDSIDYLYYNYGVSFSNKVVLHTN